MIRDGKTTHTGCTELLKRFTDSNSDSDSNSRAPLTALKCHVFGHVHNSYGVSLITHRMRGTTGTGTGTGSTAVQHVNAACVDLRQPITIACTIDDSNS